MNTLTLYFQQFFYTFFWHFVYLKFFLTLLDVYWGDVKFWHEDLVGQGKNNKLKKAVTGEGQTVSKASMQWRPCHINILSRQKQQYTPINVEFVSALDIERREIAPTATTCKSILNASASAGYYWWRTWPVVGLIQIVMWRCEVLELAIKACNFEHHSYGFLVPFALTKG